MPKIKHDKHLKIIQIIINLRPWYYIVRGRTVNPCDQPNQTIKDLRNITKRVTEYFTEPLFVSSRSPISVEICNFIFVRTQFFLRESRRIRGPAELVARSHSCRGFFFLFSDRYFRFQWRATWRPRRGGGGYGVARNRTRSLGHNTPCASECPRADRHETRETNDPGRGIKRIIA